MTTMRRLTLITLLIGLLSGATQLFAQGRTRASIAPHPDLSGETVTAVVTSVSGSLVQLANGLVTIDISNAKVSGDIVPGAVLFAVLQPGTVAANAPMPAAIVRATSVSQVTLSGSVTSVDLANGTLTLLGRTIRTTSSTKYSGLLTFAPMTLADIMPGQIVIVDASASGGMLVANSINVLTGHAPPSFSMLRGTVKSIGATSWVITSNGSDVTINVNANTKILGDPKAGDTVDVSIGGDNFAVAIMKEPTLDQVHMNLWVVSTGATEWIVGGPPGSMAPVHSVTVNAKTKISGDPKAGDRIDLVVQVQSGGKWLALSITKLP